MAEPSPDTTLRQEEDRLATPRLLRLLAVALAVIAVALLASGFWTRVRAPATPAPGTLDQQRPERVSGVLQTLLAANPAEPPAVAAARERLASFGWVDREHGVVRIPIEDAMALLAEQKR